MKKIIYKVIKRSFDFLVSLICSIIFSPIILLIALLIKLDSKGPILFKQKRIGINKNTFYILKFRTMYIDTPKDCPTHLLDNPDVYVTKIGGLLRKTSLDELPQLYNILIGQMSLVGPRPALWNQTDLIAKRDEYKANSVRPGLTGWAQVNGRDELPIDVKAGLDGEYIEKMSITFDLKCLIKTISAVITSKGIVEGNTKEGNVEK